MSVHAQVWHLRVIALARASPTGAVGLAIMLGFALVALLAPLIAPYDPVKPFTDHVLVEPDARFLLGTDGNGMDVLSRMASQYRSCCSDF